MWRPKQPCCITDCSTLVKTVRRWGLAGQTAGERYQKACRPMESSICSWLVFGKLAGNITTIEAKEAALHCGLRRASDSCMLMRLRSGFKRGVGIKGLEAEGEIIMLLAPQNSERLYFGVSISRSRLYFRILASISASSRSTAAPHRPGCIRDGAAVVRLPLVRPPLPPLST